MINAQWLETFTVLCETRHFTRTAKRLGMTQPGVSQHLRKLEMQVGQSLISKQGKSFTPTPAGEAVFELGLARRQQETELRETVLHDDPDAGRVVVACSGSFAMMLFPHLVPIMKRAPRLMVQLEAAPEETILSGVQEGRFDLGVVSHQPQNARLDSRHLNREELCLVVPIDGPADPITFHDLQSLGFIAHPDGFGYADDLFSLNFPEEYGGSDGLTIRASVNQINQIPAPVAQGVGYTLLPRSGIETYPGKERLRVVSLEQQQHHDLWMVFRRKRVLPARVRRISALIETACEGLTTR